MDKRKFIIPEYGPLAGMRVISAGSLIAGPFAATMLADFGAEVIHIERPGVGDTMRALGPFAELNGTRVSAPWAQDARNRLSLTLELNLKRPEAKEIFYGLIRESDIFIENMVWLDKLGIRDGELLELNPALVIVHVSGMGGERFGGLANVCSRASYDMIGQAFSGWLNMQGPAGGDPVPSQPYTNDFASAFAAAFGALAAYASARRTGRGQVVDVAQFEAMAQYMCGSYAAYAAAGLDEGRGGAQAFQPYGIFRTKDGALVALGAFGPAVYSRCLAAMGLDEGYFSYAECSDGPEAVGSAKGRELDAGIAAWCLEHTASEAESAMEAARVPCSRVNTARDAYENAHFRARGDWVEYMDQTAKAPVEAFGIAPKLSATPGRVWRGAPALGQDTEAVLKTILGYDDGKIARLREKKLI